jgi:high-affinity K+ transport system ATPase subunit B
MTLLHDIFFWSLLCISSGLPVFMALGMWMFIASRAQAVSELRRNKEPLKTALYVTKFSLISSLLLVAVYAMNFAAMGGLSAEPLGIALQLSMSAIPLTIGSTMGALVVLFGKLIIE